MTERGDDLSPDSQRLVGLALDGDDPRPGDRDRVRGRLAAAIGAGAIASGAAGAAQAKQPVAATAAGSGATAAAGAATTVKAALVAIGVAVTATAGYYALRGSDGAKPAQAPPAIVAVEKAPREKMPTPDPVLAPVVVAEPVVEPEAVPPPEVERAPERKVRKPVAKPTVSDDDDVLPSADSLREERALLARASKALRAGDAGAALDAVSEHQQRFPKGLLVEERSATRVLALCAAGRTSDGAKARDKFIATWPRSVHAVRVQAACD